MAEYWLWSATQKSTGSLECMTGPQKKLNGERCDDCQRNAAPTHKRTRTRAIAGHQNQCRSPTCAVSSLGASSTTKAGVSGMIAACVAPFCLAVSGQWNCGM